MFYLLIYLWVSLLMTYLLFKAFKGFFESHNDILKSSYPTAEVIATLILFYAIWPLIIAAHLYQFFTKYNLTTLNLEFNLKKWVLVPSLVYNCHSHFKNENSKIYNFLFVTVYYCYNKKKK